MFLVSGSITEFQQSETNNLKPETRNLKRLNEMRFSIRAISHALLQIVFRETSSESLLLSEVVGIVQGREIGDSFFCFFPTI